ncbi:transposable element Tcb1 transposase [Trichonephila clavipes]|nr:transposable element Tcb1 transposase [Trichonephila clavipes]
MLQHRSPPSYNAERRPIFGSNLKKKAGGVQPPSCPVSYLQVYLEVVELLYRERQVPVTSKAASLNWPVTVVGARSTEFVFIDDNVRLPQANIVNEGLQSEFITPIEWPAFSPDLNPAQHVWPMLDQRVPALQSRLTCVQEFRRALLAGRNNFPSDQLHNLILSMPRCCTDCISSLGRHTMY